MFLLEKRKIKKIKWGQVIDEQISLLCSRSTENRSLSDKTKKEAVKAFLRPFLIPMAPLNSTRPHHHLHLEEERWGARGEQQRKRERVGYRDVREGRLVLLSLHNCFIFPSGRQQCSLNPNTQSAHVFSQSIQWFHSSWSNPRMFLWYGNTEEIRMFDQHGVCSVWPVLQQQYPPRELDLVFYHNVTFALRSSSSAQSIHHKTPSCIKHRPCLW